ncbi:bifunctional 2-polyprenyl-6-hydroxyphenol methylase/3-demethylubiquinol 3-O-methyltransferase UbiG, partial [Emcibacteraceae bacterium]|nr:bifunctional 2-polyprenyl-6-hydroxyphenol methylase/3-demethylubiquinol 3-O-methyltransferase UbiG [Emcibacteraceae bacterium]
MPAWLARSIASPVVADTAVITGMPAMAHFWTISKLQRLVIRVYPFVGSIFLRILDIGCGGGLLCEPISRLGATVIGADAAEKNIKTARVHAAQMGLDIDYRHITAEELADQGEVFDAILNMEVIEHVADIPSFLGACCLLLSQEGCMTLSTLNRTIKSWAMAIAGAEYILRWLPIG